jgi:4-hydroxybenzoate polyprenyltransferase
MTGILRKIRTTLEMIKWEHSIFALPFALTAMLLAANGLPGWRTVAWILVAMVAARSAAMAFNRWADADLDAENPRTRNRAIPVGLLSRQFVLGFTLVALAVFVVAAAELNRLTLELSPVVLVVLLGYSYLKRVTQWSHLGLGLALGLAPTAAWTRASWCSPAPSRSGRGASTCCMPARTTNTIAPPDCTACRRQQDLPPRFGRREPCIWP